MTLDYLDFDYSEDADGNGVFDAMASTGPQQVEAVHADIVEVLTWASTVFPDQQAPIDEGGTWDYDLQGSRETTLAEHLSFDEHARRIRVRPASADTVRHTVTLSITGTPAFCTAFRAQFERE